MIAHVQKNIPAPIRWIFAFLWTGALLFLLSMPSGDGTPITWISRLFGGTDLTDAIGHTIIFAILTLLWAWAFTTFLPSRRAARWAVIIGIALAIITEFAQVIEPERGASVYDLLANLLGACAPLLLRTILTRHSGRLAGTPHGPS